MNTETSTMTAEPTTEATGSTESSENESGKRNYVRYAPERQAEILARAVEIGAREAAKETGVPYGTLLRWQKKASGASDGTTSDAPKRGRGRPRKTASVNQPLPLGPRTVEAVIGHPAQPAPAALNQLEQVAADLITQTLASLSKGASARVLSLLTFLKT